MMRFTRTRLLTWSVFAAIAVAVGFALRPRPIEVDLVTIARGPLRVTLDEEGETRVRDRFVVSAPLVGRVLRIDLEPGDPVEAGRTVIATFQPAPPNLLDARTRSELDARVKAARAAIARASAERDRARTELELAVSDVERQRQLGQAGIAPKERVETAESSRQSRQDALRAADAAVAAAEYELELARASLLQVQSASAGAGAAPMVIRAPVDGQVLRRHHESEAVVPAGEPLVDLGDPQQLEVVADYLSTDAVRMKVGLRAIIDEFGADDALAGHVRRIEPSGFTKISALGVEEQRVNVIVDFADRPRAASLLGDGYRVQVRIVIWEAEDVLRVPTSSLFRDGDGWAVYRVEDGIATRRQVTVGHRTGLEAEVRDGLEAGAQVIAFPSDRLTDGAAVTPRQQ